MKIHMCPRKHEKGLDKLNLLLYVMACFIGLERQKGTDDSPVLNKTFPELISEEGEFLFNFPL